MATFAFGQKDSTHYTITFNSGDSFELQEGDTSLQIVSTAGTGITILGAGYDCVAFTRYSEWRHEFAGDSLCAHSWVYAEEWDVNNILPFGISTAMYCPCGCSTQTSEARICERCFRGEFRVRYEGFDMVIREESTYSRLRKKAPKN